MPGPIKAESRVKKFSRLLDNDRIDAQVYYLPYADALLDGLGAQTLVFAIDGSKIGRRCSVLMASVIYKKRALPVAWIVVESVEGGPFPQETHIQLLRQIHPLLPEGADVVIVGDGEFDGIHWLGAIEGYGWQYVCRTAKHIWLTVEDDVLRFDEIGVQPGEQLGLPDAAFTAEGYGPLLAIAWWELGYQDPIYLVTNLELVQEACHWYARRYHIETLFSDQKSRGFNLHKSHLSEPRRLARLLIAVCLAYIWIVYLGAIATQDDWVKTIHRTDRCDLSLFQLGLRLLDHIMNEGLPIPVVFQMPTLTECVR